MMFKKFFSFILLAVMCASTSLAAPRITSAKLATHRTHEIKRGLTIEAFHPPSTFETFGEGIDHPLSGRVRFSLPDSARALAASRMGIDESGIEVRSSFEGEVASHAYLRQIYDGIPFANAVANVAFNKQNKVVSFGTSFVKPNKIASSTPTVSLEDAIASAEQTLGGRFNGHPATLEFLALQDGSASLTHVIQIEDHQTGAWVEAFVDAHSGAVLSVTNFVTDATYRVLPITEQVLTQGFQLLVNPQDTLASPNGWHSSPIQTSGNNVITSPIAPPSSSPDVFNWVQNATQSPTTQVNVFAACTNLFYVVNTVHDFTYRYGFTEGGFNFQQNNFGKGGLGNDPIIASVQDTSGTNNADFATPPDGQSGRMRMFLWTFTSPQRDGALENDIVVHENTHGVTNRMTGGGTARCLQTIEAGGMGEGWSDAMADWTEKTSSAVPDYVVGPYVVNDPAGIRSHPYSTSPTVNPLRYSNLQVLNEVHGIGEVWANMLHNVYAALVAAHGWSASSRTNPAGTEGNIVHLHLFIDALQLQPCNPTFLSARDAWIQADANRYGGANRCTLWRAFASRGLGVNAINHQDDFTVPSGC